MKKKKQAEAHSASPQPLAISGKVAFLSKDGQYTWLFLSRDGSKWKLPGGKLDPSRKPDEDVHRELAEELGADVKLSLKRVCEIDKPADGKSPAKRVIGYFAIWGAGVGEPPIDGKEHIGCMRIAVADIGATTLHKVYQDIVTQAAAQYQGELQDQETGEAKVASIAAVA